MEARTIIDIVLGLGFVIFAGMVLTADKAYTCDANGLAMNCDKLTSYYGLENGKCWNSEYGNKLCRSGWEKLAVAEASAPDFDVVKVNANGGVFTCDISSGYVASSTPCVKDDGRPGYLGELV